MIQLWKSTWCWSKFSKDSDPQGRNSLKIYFNTKCFFIQIKWGKSQIWSCKIVKNYSAGRRSVFMISTHISNWIDKLVQYFFPNSFVNYFSCSVGFTFFSKIFHSTISHNIKKPKKILRYNRNIYWGSLYILEPFLFIREMTQINFKGKKVEACQSEQVLP